MNSAIGSAAAIAASLVALAMATAPSSIRAQEPQKFRADTGILVLGPHQGLRLAVKGARSGSVVQFIRQTYEQTACSDGVCKHVVSSEHSTAALTLTQAEGASFDIASTPSAVEVRVLVVTNDPELAVNAMLCADICSDSQTALLRIPVKRFVTPAMTGR